MIGHSWGAWLAALTAAQHPGDARHVVLVGAGPLDAAYVPQINARRMANLPPAEAEALSCLTPDPNTPETLACIGALCGKADSFCPLPEDTPPVRPDSAVFAGVWPQAARLRAEGMLLDAFGRISCPITIPHGDRDPHPFDAHLLPRCSHSPWKEQYTREGFLSLLVEIM